MTSTAADQHLADNAARRAARRYGSNSGMSGRSVHHFPHDVMPGDIAELIGIRGPATLTVNSPQHDDWCDVDASACDCPAGDVAGILVDLTDTDGTPRQFVIEIREVA